MKGFNRFALVLLFTLLASCGFHLRGTVDLPPGIEPVYIGGPNPSAPLSIELRNLLRNSGIELADDAVSSRYQLIIGEQKSDRRTASLGEGARAVEYQLIETVSFELRNQEGKAVFGPNTLTERRVVTNDPNSVASSADTENLQRREMQQNLAAKIARQLQAFDYSAAQSNPTESAADTPTGSPATAQ